MTNEYLAHYGVKGMHWGVRKDGKPQGYQSNKGREGPKLEFDKRDIAMAAAKVGVAVVAAAVSGGVGGALVTTAVGNDIVIGAATSAVNVAIVKIGHEALSRTTVRRGVHKAGVMANKMVANKMADRAEDAFTRRRR